MLNSLSYEGMNMIESGVVWVGVDVNIPSTVEGAKTIEEYVSICCESILNCKIENIIWLPVKKETSNGLKYSIHSCWGSDDLCDENCNNCEKWTDTGGGFIYVKVDKILKEYATRNIDACIVGEMDMCFYDRVSRFNEWLDREVNKSQLTAA